MAMQIQLITLMLLVATYSCQQQASDSGLLGVRGRSSVIVRPDVISFRVFLDQSGEDPQMVHEALEKQTQEFISKLQKEFMLTDDQITTNLYKLNPEFKIQYNAKTRRNQFQLDGYYGQQIITVNSPVDFPADLAIVKKNIARLIELVTESNARIFRLPMFDLSPQTKSEVKDHLINMAVEDAQLQATFVTKPFGVELASVARMNINQGQNNIDFAISDWEVLDARERTIDQNIDIFYNLEKTDDFEQNKPQAGTQPQIPKPVNQEPQPETNQSQPETNQPQPETNLPQPETNLPQPEPKKPKRRN